MQEYTKLFRIRYRNKLFDIFCDSHHKKYFLEVKIQDGKEYFYYPELHDYVGLNMIYNTSDGNLYSKKYTFPNLSTVVTVAGISTFLLIGLNIPTIENFINNHYSLQQEYQENQDDQVLASDTKSHYPKFTRIGDTIYLYHNDALDDFNFPMISFNEVRNTLQNNSSIPDKYRSYITQFIDCLEERLPDIDLRIFNYNLKALEFKVISNSDWKRSNIDGYYDIDDNQIFVKEAYKDSSREKEVIFHELGHTLNNAYMEYTDPKNSKLYHIIKHFETTNDYGNSFSEGMNSILTSYLLSNSWQTYFQESARHFNSYNDVASLEYQILLLDDSYNLYDYLNGNVDYLEKYLKPLDLLETVDILDTFLKSDGEITMEDKDSFCELEQKIIGQRIIQECELGKSDLEIYKSFQGLYLTYNNFYSICSQQLDQIHPDWTIRMREASEKDKTTFIENKDGDLEELTYKTLAPEIHIYSSDQLLCNTSLNQILIYSTFDDEENTYHFGRIDYDNDVLYDIISNQQVDREELKKVAQLSALLRQFARYDIDLNISILDSEYFLQEISKKVSVNQPDLDESNTIKK